MTPLCLSPGAGLWNHARSTCHFPEASSINFRRSCTYGLGVIKTSLQYRAARLGWARPRIFDSAGPRLGGVRDARAGAAESPSQPLADGESPVGLSDGA